MAPRPDQPSATTGAEVERTSDPVGRHGASGGRRELSRTRWWRYLPGAARKHPSLLDLHAGDRGQDLPQHEAAGRRSYAGRTRKRSAPRPNAMIEDELRLLEQPLLLDSEYYWLTLTAGTDGSTIEVGSH